MLLEDNIVKYSILFFYILKATEITAAVSADSVPIITLLPVQGLHLAVPTKLRGQNLYRSRIFEIVAFVISRTDPVCFHLAEITAAVAIDEVSVVALLGILRVVLAISALRELDLRGAD